MTNIVARTYEESFAQWAPFYRKNYSKACENTCRGAIADIYATLPLHERGVYTGKLYAELDAARERLQFLRGLTPRHRAI